MPLIIILLISSTGFISNLKAKEVRPENYGKTNILFNMIAQDELFLEDEESYEEIIEGPLPQETTQTSYLEGEVLISDNEVLEEDEGIDTLVTTTSDSASLISPEITDPEVVTKKRDKVIDYVVQIGDTISTIAQKFSISTNSILWENSLSYYSTIKPGQTLKILPTSGINYKIKSGDTIQKIVKKYGGSTKEIIEFNKLTDASDIVIGQEIIIPSGKKPVSYPVRPSNPTNTSFSQATTVSNAKLQWPTNSSRITQYYGWRHTGLDIGNKTGQPIYASESGKITKAGWNRGGYGYYIMINHGGGLETLYAHLSRIDVKIGQNVSRGQVIGGIGSTGRSTGPHIHFEVRVNNRRSNPLSYIR